METIGTAKFSSHLGNQIRPGRSDSGRLERDLMSEAKITGRMPGWIENEIVHTSPIVWYGPSNFPFDYIFSEMKNKDPDLASFDMRLRSKLVSLPREIVPADSSDGAQEAVALCEEQVRLLSGGAVGADTHHGGNNWVQFLYAMLEHVWSGTSFIEPNWGDDFFIYELVQRPMHAFGFVETDSGGAELRMRRVGFLEQIPPGKIIFARNSMEGYPWGNPMAQYVFWLWRSKIYNWLDWALFLERWVKPIVDITYEIPKQTGAKDNVEGDTKEADDRELKSVIAAQGIHGNGYFVHSSESDLTILGQNVSGGEQYKQFYTMCAQQEGRLLLSEITSSGLEGFGSFKKTEIAVNEVGAERMNLFAPSISSIVKSTIFTWIVQTWIPGAPVPNYFLDVTSQAHRKALFDGVEASLNFGVDVAEGDARRAWGTRRPHPNEGVINASEAVNAAMARDMMNVARSEIEKEDEESEE